jgi:hypothetical protein
MHPYAFSLLEKFLREESAGKERTFPPPADGLCVPFLCKGEWGVNDGSAQVRCGG